MVMLTFISSGHAVNVRVVVLVVESKEQYRERGPKSLFKIGV